MPNKRDLSLEEYGIDKYTYRELHNFCLRYPQMKRRLVELRNPYRSPNVNDTPRSRGVSTPTESSAEKAAELSKSTEMIEQSAMEAGGEDYQCLLLAVTEDVPHYYLKLLSGLRTGEKRFAAKKRRFYYLLAQRKKII